MPATDALNAAQHRVYRGEVRNIYPTPEYPDPAKAARTDPHGVLEHWLSGSHPYAQGSGYGVWESHPETGEMHLAPFNPISVGTHWSKSPQSIPERFTEPVFTNPQRGVAMPRSDINYIKAEEAVQRWHAGGREQAMEEHYVRENWTHFEDPEHIVRAEAMVRRRESAGTVAYRDLSHGGAAKAFQMGVVWHGLHTPEQVDPDNPPTNYEEEVNLRPGSQIQVTHARFHIPESGHTTIASGNPKHPTPDIVMAAHKGGWEAPAYHQVHERGYVPWSVVQFQGGGLHLPIEEGYRARSRL